MELVFGNWKESLVQLPLFLWLIRAAVRCGALGKEEQSCTWGTCKICCFLA